MIANPLLQHGYPSIGCEPCTRGGRAGRGPARGPLGRAAPRPNAGCTDDRRHQRRPPTLDRSSELDRPRPSSTCSSPRRSTSFARSPASSSARCCCSAAARTRSSCSHLAVKAFWPGGCRSRCCTSTPGTTSPRCSRSATRRARGSACGSRRAGPGVDRRRQGAERPGRHPQPAADDDAARRHRAEHRFDAVFGGGRRDEEKARAKERVFSLRDEFGQWDPRRQRPELWDLYNGRHAPGEHVRVFPMSNWTELDVWRYIAREDIDAPADLLRARARGLPARRDVARRPASGRPRAESASRPGPSATGPSAT